MEKKTKSLYIPSTKLHLRGGRRGWIKKEGEKRRNKAIVEIVEEVERDSKVRELMEENQRKYGMLIEEDLKKVFTI